MNRSDAIEALNKLGEIQSRENCPLKTCPRCGELMPMPATRNALSRRVDCYICPDCGISEALEDFPSCEFNSLPVERWSIVRDVLDVLNGTDTAS